MQKYNDQFVVKVNEIFHDLEAKHYEEFHPEIFKDESYHWEKLFHQHVSDKENIKILDIGSGTGFVPLTLGKYLKREDYFLCTDVSNYILSVCRKNLIDTNFKCKFDFLLLENSDLSSINDKFDLITLNSVLHHIPNLDIFLPQIKKLLNNNGVLIIGHEPNKLFFNHSFLWKNYKFLSFFFNPTRFIYEFLQGTFLSKLILGILKSFTKKMNTYSFIYKQINNELLKQKIIETPLSINEIQSIVDFHSPTAGKLDKSKGFEPSEIAKKYFPDFSNKIVTTYMHLFKIYLNNRLLKKYSTFLAKKYPQHGAIFFLVLKNEKI